MSVLNHLSNTTNNVVDAPINWKYFLYFIIITYIQLKKFNKLIINCFLIITNVPTLKVEDQH